MERKKAALKTLFLFFLYSISLLFLAPNKVTADLVCDPPCQLIPGRAPACIDPSTGKFCNPPYNNEATPLKGDCIDTAIGCVPIEQQDFVTFLLKWAIGIAGGIAFILIVISSFQIMTSQGDPKRLQAGKELLSSAIMGLMLLIFSVFILRIIGVEILKIPGLS